MVEQRTLEEILTLYNLEPSLADIYVEGDTDKAIISWFLSRLSKSHVRVYTIDIIDIQDSIIQKYNLNNRSNRSKVLALSAELYATFPDKVNVLCIADRDFDDQLPRMKPPPLLQFTDGNSMECYALNDTCFRKFSFVVLGDPDLTLLDSMDSIRTVLRRIYTIRLANEMLSWGMEGLPFTRYVSVMGTRIAFDEDRFIRAYLQKNNRWGDKNIFRQAIESCSGMLSNDPQKATRGHDISELLLHILRKLSPKRRFGNAETVEGALLGTLESDDLRKTTLFQRIAGI